MPLPLLLLAAQVGFSDLPPLPPCRPAQLRLSADGRDGDFNGMSHSGTELSIRNRGSDCMLPALPRVQLRTAGGHLLAATRQAPIGMHPGPAMVPLRLAAGHRATIDLRWISGPVFPRNRSVNAATVSVRIGTGTIRAALTAKLYGEAGKPVSFDQAPAKAAEGMAEG